MERRHELLICLLASLLPSLARADGGTVRASERVNGYQVTVFSSPTPFRAGPVDISVLVQDPAGRPVPDVRVTVWTWLVGQPQQATAYPAPTGVATNKLFHAAKFDLHAAGWWTVEIRVDDGQETRRVYFDLEAAEPVPPWADMGLWIGLPVLPVILFAIHQRRVRKIEARRTHPVGPSRHGKRRPCLIE